jgi:hypothetical protein
MTINTMLNFWHWFNVSFRIISYLLIHKKNNDFLHFNSKKLIY